MRDRMIRPGLKRRSMKAGWSVPAMAVGVWLLGSMVQAAVPQAKPQASGELARLAIVGTGTPAGTVALFVHGFPKGELKPADVVVLHRADHQTPLRTQMNPVTSWPDGSVKVALLAVEAPALPKAAVLECMLVKAPPADAGPALDLGALLQGRTATLTIRPKEGQPWTFNLLTAAKVSTDRWHHGPLAGSTRVETKVPPEHVGGVTSVRLVADLKLASRRNRWLGNLQSEGGQLVFFGTGPGPWPVISKDGTAWAPAATEIRVPGADPGAVKLRDGSWLLLVTGPPRPGTPSAEMAPRQGLALAEDEGQNRSVEPPPRGGPEATRFESVFVRIPSSAAGTEGVAARVLIPRPPRFTHGAPVVIQVAGGVQAGHARGRPEYVGHGFVEIHFAFPGGGQGEERSGGTYDFRGPNCVRALADVIRFATGRLADKQGRFLAEVVRGVNVLTNNVGLVGSSLGGNACGLAMAKHGDEFPNLAWYASMESPYGEGAANVELGGHESGVNPAYDPKTGALDLSKLAWSDELSPGLFRKPMLVATREMKGAFYFDLNGDGRFARGDDFPCNCFVGDAGGGVKAWYSPRVLAEAEKRKLIRGNRPAHLPTLAEAREFWAWRDAGASIPEAVRRCTNLAVIVYANERDHVQADPAHTHILEQVEGFRRAGAPFVRLNPDRAYVEHLAPPGRPRFERTRSFPDNPAGKPWTRTNITEGLEPSTLPLGLYMQAAVCELADRTQAGDWSANLPSVLFPDAPRAPALVPPRQRRASFEGQPDDASPRPLRPGNRPPWAPEPPR